MREDEFEGDEEGDEDVEGDEEGEVDGVECWIVVVEGDVRSQTDCGSGDPHANGEDDNQKIAVPYNITPIDK